MTDRNEEVPAKPSTLIERELYRDVALSSARMEMERRRLVARLAENSSPKTLGLVIRFSLVGAGLAAAAAIAIAVLLGQPWNSGDLSRKIEISGLWTVADGDAVFLGRPIEVPASAGAKLILSDETTIWAAGSSSLRSSPEDPGTFELNSGKILVSVSTRAPGDPFSIETPHGEVIVHGTVFSVSVDETGMDVRLHEGSVEVKGTGEKVFVSPGYNLKVSAGTTVAAGPIDPVDVLEDLLIAEPTLDLPGPSLPVLSLSTPRVDRPRSSAVRAVVSPSSPDPEPKRAAQGTSKKKRTRDAGNDSEEVEAPNNRGTEPFADPRLAQITVESSPVGSTDELLIEAYEEVSRGNHSTGRAILQQYLESHPDGRYWSRIKDLIGEPKPN